MLISPFLKRRLNQTTYLKKRGGGENSSRHCTPLLGEMECTCSLAPPPLLGLRAYRKEIVKSISTFKIYQQKFHPLEFTYLKTKQVVEFYLSKGLCENYAQLELFIFKKQTFYLGHWTWYLGSTISTETLYFNPRFSSIFSASISKLFSFIPLLIFSASISN